MNNNSNKTVLNETTMILEDEKLDVILTDNDIEGLDLDFPIDFGVKEEEDFESVTIPENQAVITDNELEGLDLDFPIDFGVKEEEDFESVTIPENQAVITDNELEGLDLDFPIDFGVKEEEDFESVTIPENQVVITDNELEALDLDLFLPSQSIPVSKSSSVGKGLVSIIWAPTGKRITFDQSLIYDLGINETIQIGYNENQLLLGADLGISYKNRKLKRQKSKSVLYDTALIKELIKQFNLDYQDVTSRTFDEVSFKQVQGSKVALITIKKS